MSHSGHSVPDASGRVAAVCERGRVVSLLTDASSSTLMLAGLVYMVFLAFAFQGPIALDPPQRPS